MDPGDSWLVQGGTVGAFLAILAIPFFLVYGVVVFLWDMLGIVLDAIDLARERRGK